MAYEIHAESVELDGTTYRLANGRIQIEDLQPWKDPIRTIGNQRRSDRSNLSQIVSEDTTFGIGFPNTKGAIPIEGEVGDPSYRGLFSSEAETRFNGQITLPGELETSTHTKNATSGDHTYYRMYQAPRAGSDPLATDPIALNIIANQSIAQYDGSSNWAQLQDLTGESNCVPRTAFRHKGNLFIMGGTESTVWSKFSKINAAGSASLVTPSTNVGEPVYSGVSFRDLIIVACFDSGTGMVEIWKSSDEGDNFYQVEGMTASVVFDGPNIELIQYLDASGSPALYLTTTAGLYMLNFVDEILERQVDWSQRFRIAAAETTRLHYKPAVVNGLLYLPRGQHLYEYHYSGNYRDISPITQARLDPAHFGEQSEVAAVCDAGDELFVAFSGTTIGTIWSYNGNGYHYITKIDGDDAVINIHDIIVASGALSSSTLHISYTEAGATNNCDFRRVDQVLEEPLHLSQKTYASAGFVTFPVMDGGMGEVDTNIVQIGGNFEDLTSTATAIVTIDLDKAGSFGNSVTYNNVITGGTQLYASGAGLSAKTWQLKVTFARGGSTTTPVMLNLVTYFEKLFPDLNRYTFDIDLAGSLQYNQGRLRKGAAQSLIGKLLTSRKKITLLPFEWGGEDLGGGKSPRYVRIENFPRIEEREGQVTKGASQSITKAFIRIVAADRV